MPQSALITKATSELCSNWIRFYDSPYDISDSSTLCDLQFISVDQRNELSVSLGDGSVWSLPNFQSPTTQIPLQQLTSNVATQDDSYIWLLVVCTWVSNRDFHRGRQRKNVWLKLTLALRNVRLFTSVVSDSWFLLSGVSQWATGEWQRLRKWLIQTVRSKQLAPANTQQLPHYSVAWVKGIRPMNPPAANRKHSC